MMFGIAHRLWTRGVVGLNKRNADYLLAYNGVCREAGLRGGR